MPMTVERTLDTVVFDLGNVLLDWDRRYLFGKIFDDPVELEHFLTVVCPMSWHLGLDKGRPWPELAAEALARGPAYAHAIDAYRSRWQETIPGAIGGTVAILEELAAAGVPLYAISNFSGELYRETAPRFPFLRHFRGLVISGDERLLKPDPAIYERLAALHGVELGRSVFIDDSLPNVTGATRVGMHALHFTTPERLRADLVALGFPLR
ncbi:MAG TPA: HAD family phosphatase [Hyphomicrobiaceae bacterium]|nr:HAD family phosphatase [Hyphomicrobiaceae bacterium]